MRRNLAACFVLSVDASLVKGYYTLSNAAVDSTDLPEAFSKKLPGSYKRIPATLLGRLAIDNTSKGKGFGELLLIDALKRSFDAAHTGLGSFAILVDPIDDHAKGFYAKYGFIELPECGKMFLPMKTVGQLFPYSQP